MPNIGPLELGIILLVVLIIFGPKRLPTLGRQLGSGMREFKDSVTGKNKGDDEDDVAAAQLQPALSAAPAAPAVTTVDATTTQEPAQRA